MFQIKKRKLLVLTTMILVVALIGAVAYAFTSQGEHGSITVNGPFASAEFEAAVNTLTTRIGVAHTEQGRTDVATAAVPGSSNPYWATQQVHNDLSSAIAEAQGVLDGASFSVGDTFDVSIDMSGNAGFSAMMFRFELPPQLELISVKGEGQYTENLQGPRGWNGETFAVSPPITGAAYIGWGGRTTGNYTADGTMLTYTLRVRADATPGVTAPITVGFFNDVTGEELPSADNDGQVQFLNMSVQGTPMSLGTVVPLGGVIIN